MPGGMPDVGIPDEEIPADPMSETAGGGCAEWGREWGCDVMTGIGSGLDPTATCEPGGIAPETQEADDARFRRSMSSSDHTPYSSSCAAMRRRNSEMCA